MDVTVLLADAAQTANDGKIYALGLGWSNTTTPLPPQAVIVLFDVPWDETNQPFNAVLQLVDADGHAVEQATPMGNQPVRVDINFEAGRSPGMIRGSSVTAPITIPFPPGMPLLPGRYEWRVSVNGHEQEGWRRGFSVLNPPGTPPPQQNPS